METGAEKKVSGQIDFLQMSRCLFKPNLKIPATIFKWKTTNLFSSLNASHHDAAEDGR